MGGNVAGVTEVHAACTFMVKIGSSMYFRNVGNNAHVRTVFLIVSSAC
jgi:hypothetical protein